LKTCSVNDTAEKGAVGQFGQFQSKNIQDDNSVVVNRFHLVAQRFCSPVDSAGTLDKAEFLLQVYRLLPELIGEAMRLPAEGFGDDEDDEDQETNVRQLHFGGRFNYEEWSQLFNALKEKLGNWNYYNEVFDPTEDNEVIHGSLPDDIAGIYCDLKEGIELKDSDNVLPQDVIFKWRCGFYSHWGKHAIDALRTLHFRLNDTLTGLESV
jgi:hypothetical protein